MATTYFTSDHEWLRVEGGIATVGITDYAQEQMGDLVFVELPEVGRALKKGDTAVVVESVKAASDVYSPLTGAVLASNGALAAAPELVNTDPYGEGWLFKLKPSNNGELAQLLDAAAYEKVVAEAH